MIPKTPRTLFRLAIWVVLLSIGGCGGSKPDPKSAEEAACAAAQEPLPASAPAEAQELAAAARALCRARKALERDGG